MRKLSKDANDGLAKVHLDHSVLGLLKGILPAGLGLGIQRKKDQGQLRGEE